MQIRAHINVKRMENSTFLVTLPWKGGDLRQIWHGFPLIRRSREEKTRHTTLVPLKLRKEGYGADQKPHTKGVR